MKIIIPMSGIGKRFMDVGYQDPKPLIKVDGKPMIHHVIDLFPGETDFIFICNEIHLEQTDMRTIIQEKCKNAKIISIKVAGDPNRGPVSSTLYAVDDFSDDEEVIISYCDYGTVWNYHAFLYDMRISHADGGIACYKGFHPHMLGTDNYAFVREEGKWMKEIREKQSFTNERMSEFASNGTYYFRKGSYVKHFFKEMIDLNMRVGEEFYVSLTYNLLVQNNLKVRIHEIEKMLQWGTPKDLEDYNQWSDYFKNHWNKETQTHLPSENDPILLLPMAGRGSRFVKDGYETPKPLLEIDGIPMFVRAVQQLPRTKTQLLLCQDAHIHQYPIKERFKEYFPNSIIETIDYITEGQACSCEILSQNIPDDVPLLISACDNGIAYSDEEYQKLRNDPEVDVIVWSFSRHPTSRMYPEMYAWLDVDETTKRIKEVSVKQPFPDRPNKYCIIGTMYFRETSLFRKGLDDVYKNNIRTNNEFYVDNVIQALITQGYTCKILNVDHYLCWGTPNDYKTYQYWSEYFIPTQKKNLIFIGYPAYGDFLSYNGMIRHLVKFYDRIQFLVFNEEHRKYLNIMFKDITDKVHFCIDVYFHKNTDILNITTSMYENMFRNRVPPERYFDRNHLFPFPGIMQLAQKQNNNASLFYSNVGICPDIRLDKFFFIRDHECELKSYTDYIIRNDHDGLDMYGISPHKKHINVHYMCENPFDLLSLMENASEIHMIENSSLLMLYHMEYSGITKVKSPVFVHVYARNRGDKIINMFKEPQLANWHFLY
jgi:NDP-sugar pyrophosphorylase family protein